MKILITGCAGFIGYHLSKKLSLNNDKIFGIDNLNNYYDVDLKKKRLNNLSSKNFSFSKIDIKDYKNLKKFFKKNRFDIVYHLAAQAGVRYSIFNPETYFENNLKGFFNILECCREFKIKNLIFASTSSVYGKQKKFPLKENYLTDKPLSFYAATKKCNEIMAYSYSQIYNLKCTALRFFTVFGPFGRPDMALYKFSNSIVKNKNLELYNSGNHTRDFTYIDDVIIYLERFKKKKQDNFFEVFNVCSNKPINLKKYLYYIEKNLDKKAKIKNLKLQQGDVVKTHGDNKKIKEHLGNHIFKKIDTGINEFIVWFKRYRKK
jgi:UDP-glucuronate 4-epimerase